MAADSTQGAQDLHLDDFTLARNSGPVPKYYGEALVELGAERDDIVVLCADLSPGTETGLFRDRFPDRFVLTGIAEANMVGAAAGMARMGDVAFAHSFCVFLTRRVYDQVAMQVAYPRTNVKLVGFLPGLATVLGVSHQAIDDIALMRALPNMTVIEPSGPEQMAAAGSGRRPLCPTVPSCSTSRSARRRFFDPEATSRSSPVA